MSQPRQCVVVFAKNPRLGAVKTRLSPPLTPHQALELYRACLLGTLRIVLSLPARIAKMIYWSGPGAMRLPKPWLGRLGSDRQRGSNLGVRMANTFAELLRNGWERVVIVGSDHPTLPRARLVEAFQKLAHVDVVLGPSLDGGYYLVGCRRLVPAVFRKIPWGTSRVFRMTCARLKTLRIPFALLPAWYDVDRARDLARLRRDLARMPRSANFPHELNDFLKTLAGRIKRSNHRQPPDRPGRKRRPGRE